MIFTDTHTHLYAKDYDGDREEMIQRAIDAGVERMYIPGIGTDTIGPALALNKRFPKHCFPMIGLHPCDVKADYLSRLKVIESYLENKEFTFCAVGEVGLDFYHDVSFEQEQRKAFLGQMDLALNHKLPLVLHVRKAFAETMEMIRVFKQESGDRGGELRGIFHCFSGTVEEAMQVLDLGGFLLGIGGVLTFKNSGLQQVVEQVGLEHLVLETDAPWLAPVPYRGKRNESGYIPLIARRLSEIKGCSLEEVAEQTTSNSNRIFGTPVN